MSNSASENIIPDKSIEKRLLSYLKPHKRTVAIGLACAAANAGIAALLGYGIKLTIDHMKNGEVGRLNTVCMVVVAVIAVKGIFSYGQSYFLSLTAQRITTELRAQIFSHLHTLSLAFFNRRRTGAIMSTVTNDIPVIQNATMTIRDIISAPLTVVVSFAMLFYMSWRLTLAAIVFIPMMGLVINKIGKRIRRISDVVQGKMADITTIAEETVAGVRIVKSFATEKHEIDRFSEENDKAFRAIIKGVKKSAQLKPIIEFIGTFGIALVLFLGGNEVARNEKLLLEKLQPETLLTSGGLAMFVYLLQQIARAVSDLGGINVTRQQALAAAQRIFTEVLDQKSEVSEKKNAALMPHIEGEILIQRRHIRIPGR